MGLALQVRRLRNYPETNRVQNPEFGNGGEKDPSAVLCRLVWTLCFVQIVKYCPLGVASDWKNQIGHL